MRMLPMNVLFVIAELDPLVKVGGTGDVGGGLPRALRRLGLDVRVALPFYSAIDRQQLAPERLASLPGDAAVWQAEVRGVPVYLIEQQAAFGRAEVYGYEDDPARFLAFCDALLAADSALAWRPDLLHLHDWHPGFLAARLAGRAEHPWAALPRVATIHNLAFTGPFDAAFAREHGLAISWDSPASQRPSSALAQAVLHADLVTTVSPTYAREILSPELGGGMTWLLRSASGGGDRLSGILNGIDVEQYDPATDAHLASRFDGEHLDRRVENKRALQQQLALPVDDETPLVGMVSRLFWQKGPDLAAVAIERLLMNHRLQFVALGKGDEEHERLLTELAARYPQQVAVRIDFDLPLGQLIYGGCDLFLMPSRYEPCGLGQLIAMRYGAVPVVRRTGGLADSVEPYDALRDQGTGFVFEEGDAPGIAAYLRQVARGLLNRARRGPPAYGRFRQEAITGPQTAALEEALTLYQDKAAWRRLQLRGMAQDFSWERAARRYVELYERATALRGRPAKEAAR